MSEAELTLQKLPPQNLEAEQMVLGAVLIEPAAIDEVKAILRPEDFYKSQHGSIFAAMLAMRDHEEAIDLVTMSDALRAGNVLEKCGGASYLSVLVSLVPTAANIRHHARIVADRKQLRDVIHFCSDAIGSAYRLAEPDTVITDLVSKLNGARRNEGPGIVTQRELILDAFSATEKRYEHRGKLSGIPTGYTELDLMLDGYQPGDLIIVAGRPAMGKTAFAECTGDSVGEFFLAAARCPECAEAGKRICPHNAADTVGWVSIEMSKRQLGIRALSRASGVSNMRIRRGELNATDWDRLSDGTGHHIGLPIVYETTALQEGAVSRAIDIQVQKHRSKIILVDYIQLMATDEKSGRNREQEVSAQSRMLKHKAKQHNIPVVALSQLNRAVESRGDGNRPRLSDLRDSGGIEQDADVIIFPYREEVYKPCPCGENCMCGLRGKAEALVRKNRMGPCGDARLIWEKRTTSFRDAISS